MYIRFHFIQWSVTVCSLSSEETSSEVQTRMRRIQANELRQLKDLTGFLDSQIQFTSKCLSELRDAQVDWYDECVPCFYEHM